MAETTDPRDEQERLSNRLGMIVFSIGAFAILSTGVQRLWNDVITQAVDFARPIDYFSAGKLTLMFCIAVGTAKLISFLIGSYLTKTE